MKSLSIIVWCALFTACTSNTIEIPVREIVCDKDPIVVDPGTLEDSETYKFDIFTSAAEAAVLKLEVTNPVTLQLARNYGEVFEGGCVPVWVEFDRMPSDSEMFSPTDGYKGSREFSIYIARETLQRVGVVLRNMARHEICHIYRGHARIIPKSEEDINRLELDAESCVLDLVGEEEYKVYKAWAHRGLSHLKKYNMTAEEFAQKDLDNVLSFKERQNERE